MSLSKSILDKASRTLSDADNLIADMLEEAWQEGYDEGYADAENDHDDD